MTTPRARDQMRRMPEVEMGGSGAAGQRGRGIRCPSAPLLRCSALLLAATIGCFHFEPPHAQPPLPTPPVFDPSLNVADGRPPRAPEIGWREFFRDPRLDALIATALDYNRDLRVAVGRIDVARGQYRIRGADRIPTVVGTAGIQHTYIGPDAAGSSGTLAFATDRASISVGVTAFELDFWGRVRNLTEAAKSDYLATVQAQRAFQLSLIQDVAAAYF